VDLRQQSQKKNLINILQILIENGADVNVKMPTGCSPLHHLCQYYQHDDLTDVIQLVVQNRADVNARSSIGWTPLHSLCENYEQKGDVLFESIKFLVEMGADVSAESSVGWTPLHYLCNRSKKENLTDIIQLLVQNNGADVNFKSSLDGSDGLSPV